MQTKRLFRAFLFVFIFLLLVSRLGLPTRAEIASGPEVWTATYDGGLEDASKALTVDAAGNVYVTGVSARAYPNNWDIVTVKYNAAGVQQWMQTYDGPGNSTGADWDEGVDIAVDAQGYVYVTGTSISLTEQDYITLRYTPQGALDWEQRFNGHGPANSNSDNAYALALDGTCLYITGTSVDENYQLGILTVVYNLEGAYVREMWYPAYSVSGLVVDEAGNIYIAGQTFQEASFFDFFTVKFNPDGTQAWAQTYSGPGSQNDSAMGLAVDGDGNVIVTGGVEIIEGSMSHTIIATLKYSPSGDLLWDELYTGENDGGAHAAAVMVDSDGNVYVGGSIWGWVDGWDNGILKYDADGNLLWERLYRVEGNESIYHLAFDTAGNLFATGNSSTAQFDSSTTKFDPQGNMLWLYRSSGEMTAHDLALDAAGYIYVTGESEENYSTIKYPPNPALFVSVADAMGYEGSYPESYTDIQLEFFITLSQAVDYDLTLTYHTEDGTATTGSDYLAASGSVTIQAGWTGTSFKVTLKEDTLPDEGDEYFNVILDPVANARLTRSQVRGTIFEDDRDTQHWVARTTGGNENIYQNTAGLLVDHASNAYVVYRSSDSLQDLTLSKLVKYNSDGGFEWEQSYVGSAVDALLVDDSFVYITGVTADSHAFLVKYTTAGAFLWEYLYDHVDYLDEGFIAITADPWGNILVLGEATPKSQLAARIPDFLLIKLTPDGGLTWERTHSGMAGSWDTPSGIGTDYLGGVYATGVSGSGDSGSVIKVFKYTAQGVLDWDPSYVFQGQWDQSNGIQDSWIDLSGNIYLAASVHHEGRMWGAALKFDPAGNLAWERECPAGGCGYTNSPTALTVDKDGYVILTGWVNGGSALYTLGMGKYSPASIYSWDDGIDNGGTGLDITTDPKSLIYVAGGVYQEGWNDDYFTRVYSPDGHVIWEQGYTGNAQVSRDVATHIALDANGEIYATGTSGYDIATLNYGAVPQPLMMDIGNLFAREVPTGTTQAIFDVRLSQSQEADITFDYTTVEGTAVPGQDYLSASGSVTIPAGHTFATFEVPVLGDALKEPDEFFFITLSNPSLGTFRYGQVRAIILDSSNIPHFLPLTLR